MIKIRTPRSSNDLRVSMYGFSGISVRVVANCDGRSQAIFLTLWLEAVWYSIAQSKMTYTKKNLDMRKWKVKLGYNTFELPSLV